MGYRTGDEWYAAVRGLPAILDAIDRTQPDDGLRQAIFAIWRLMVQAPSPFLERYADLAEASYLAEAEAIGEAHPDSFISPLPPDEQSAKVMHWAGANLRRLELLFASGNLGSKTVDPQRDWLIELGDDEAFFVPTPRRAWKTLPAPESDFRAFPQRGLTRVRLIPRWIDGGEVQMIQGDWMPAAVGDLAFGAVLFPKAEFDWVEKTESFIVTHFHDPDAEEIIDGGLREAHETGCIAVVFPELTIAPDHLNRICELLVEKPWGRDGLACPAIVVAGSWHVAEGDQFANVTPILNGYGDQLVEYRKRLAYRDDDGRREGIKTGEEVPILVLDEGLFTFGICLDFATMNFPKPYEDLDVDFVLVPSCGNDLTMAGHISASQVLHVRRNTRAFVVQQRFPRGRRESAGFVLEPGKPLTDLTPKMIRERKRWKLSTTARGSGR